MAVAEQATSGRAFTQEYARERRAFADQRDTATSLPSINHLTSEADEEPMEWVEEPMEWCEEASSQEMQEKEEGQQVQEETVARQAGSSKNSIRNSKKKDLSKLLACHQGPITTLMIRNLPCSVDPVQLAGTLDGLGYARKYDLLMMPTSSRSTGRRSNLGYGFVNFKDASDAESFAQAFEGYSFSGTTSAKVCATQVAHVQGFEATFKTFRRVKYRRSGSFMCAL